MVFLMGFWLNPLNKVRGSHMLKTLFNVLFYDIKHTRYTTLVIRKLLFKRLNMRLHILIHINQGIIDF